MELRNYLILIRRWLWLLVLVIAGTGLVTYFVSRAQAPVYRATATLLVNEGGASTRTDVGAIQLNERLALSYVQRLTNYEVLQQAVSNLGLDLDPDDLKRNVQVNLIINTQLIQLSVEDTDPAVAAALANEIPAVFAERNTAQQLERYTESKQSLQEELDELQVEITASEAAVEQENRRATPDQATLAKLDDNLLSLRETHSRLLQSYEDIRIAEARSLNSILIDDAARVPDDPVRPRVVLNTLLAVIVSGALGLGVVVLLEYLDETVKDPTSVEKAVGLSTLGAIARVSIADPSESLIVARQPRSPVSEAYRQVRTNVQFAGVGREIRTMLVTSANPSEGKTTTAANLALTFVQAGKRVILVDADLRRPSQHTRFGLSNNRGLTNLMINEELSPSFLVETATPGLRVLTSGPLPPNPAELLGSERMREILNWLKGLADYVIVDSPPILAVTDGVVLSRLVDTTVFVVNAAKTRYQALTAAVEQLTAVSSHVAGVILNQLDQKSGRYYYHYYYRDSSYYTMPDGKAKRRRRRSRRRSPAFAFRLIESLRLKIW
ncbi:MAG: polysaccharide biosynthesis tyrosine autokinase [Chloroflexota bacterium]